MLSFLRNRINDYLQSWLHIAILLSATIILGLLVVINLKIAIGLLVALLGSLIFLFSPKHRIIEIWLVGVLVPYSFSVTLAGEGSTITPIRYLAVATIFIGLHGIHRRKYLRRESKLIGQWIVIFLILAFAAMVYNWVIYPPTLWQFTKYFDEQAIPLSFFFLIVAIIESKEEIKNLISFIVIISVPIIIYGFIEHFLRYNILYPVWATDVLLNSSYYRITSIFYNPIEYGLYLSLITPLALSFLFTEKKFARRLLWGSYIIVLVLNLLWTFSRGPWIGTLFGIFLVFVGYFKNPFYRKRFPLIPVVILVMAVSLYWGLSTGQQIREVFDNRILVQGTINERFELWRVAFNVFLENPILGVGLRNFQYYSYLADRRFGYSAVENYFFRALAENGILGFTAFITIIGIVINKVIKIINNRQDNSLYLGISGGIVALIVCGLSNDSFGYPQITLYWVTFVALLSMCNNKLISIET